MKILAAAGVLLLAACASAPPAVPLFPGGPLAGRLENGVYHERRDWFEIASPVHPDKPDYPLLAISEQTAANFDFVNFVPSRAGGQFYRVYVEDFRVSNRPVPAMDEIADSAMHFFGRQLMQSRIEPVKLVEEKPWRLGQTSGILRLYTQRVPIGSLTDSAWGLGEDYTAYILVYVTAQQGKVAVLWSEWPVGCSLCMPPPPGPPAADDDAIDQALAANGLSLPFFASFHYGAH